MGNSCSNNGKEGTELLEDVDVHVDSPHPPRQPTDSMRPGNSPTAKVQSHLDTSMTSQLSTNDGVEPHAVILAWAVSIQSQATVDRSQLSKLNEHIVMCNELFGTETLMDEATTGLIRGRPMASEHMTAEDTAVRLGQLLCRWGASNRIGIRVGVASGCLKAVRLNSCGRISYFGDSMSQASQLASVTGQDLLVHMSAKVKEGLSALRLMKVMISHNQASYFLDPATTVPSYFSPAKAEKDNAGRTSETFALSLTGIYDGAIEPYSKVSEDGVQSAWDRSRRGEMTLNDFTELLSTHGVDITKFGTGVGKSMAEFYEAVVKEQKSYLVIANGKLERVVNLVRISLRIRDENHKLRELRIASQETSQGDLRIRDQPLAVVLKIPEHGQWQEAVERCFEQKLQISARIQKACFSIDMDSYSMKEERAASDTIPGIMTTYKSHNIVINIKDKTKKELKSLGLPAGDNFEMGAGAHKKNWMWAPVEDRNEDELMTLLQRHGIDVSEFAPQAFAELYDEVYGRQSASLDVQGVELVRTIRIIKVWLHADILNVDHVLVVKAKWQKGQFDAMNKDTSITMRMNVDQDWGEALEAALLTRLGLTSSFQAGHLAVDKSSHRLTEEVGYSRSYPGLKTLYMVNEVNVHVLNSDGGHWQFIGLPSGTDFTFARREAIKGPETEDVVITHWCWKTREMMENQERFFIRRSVNSAPSVSDEHMEPDDPEDESRNVAVSEEEVLRNRVPVPQPVTVSVMGSYAKSDVGALMSIMGGKKTDWRRARKAAERIRDPRYTCKDFHDDIVAAFPELKLYCVVAEQANQTISGRTADDEYQRTIGALFAMFWIMRLDIGGKESFCYGLDKQWQPRKPTDARREAEEWQKRKDFLENTNWGIIKMLLVDAQLLSESRKGLQHDPERTLAMMVLLAIHDIMKMGILLPKVREDIPEFGGYKTGETINDHDAALSYVLVHAPQALPSFAGLPPAARQSVAFTHCKMEYNMGWLVQAEAPPGALFRSFKHVITEGKAPACDVAFYFVHWFADLAAAEPCPLEGCEKFVLKFPQRVLSQFLASFSVVQQLSTQKSETEVLEEYLVYRWQKHEPPLGMPPSGKGAVAQMRAILMAQGNSMEVLTQFADLAPEDKDTLCVEMAYTGCKEQSFPRDVVPPGKGPALLVYYSPALMQRAGKKDAKGAFKILAEVFRQARALWPLSAELADSTVTVRIDALKELECPAIMRPESGFTWVLGRTSGKDAMVKLLAVSALQDLDWESHKILTFNGPPVRKRRKGRVSTFLPSMPRVRRLSLW